MALTLERFISDATIKHNNKFDYSLVEFENGYDLIKIICPIHGTYEQRLFDHRYGSGCPKCAGRNRSKDEKIEAFNKTHNNQYSYAKYSPDSSDFIVICNVHGDFKTTYYEHLCGRGCPKCSRKNITTNEIINEFKQIHNDIYDYSKFVYKTAKTKSTIICKKHGTFEMSPSKHLYGQKCPRCKGLYKTEAELLNLFFEIHNNQYTYAPITDCRSKIKIKITCNIHGDFLQSIGGHLAGRGCVHCAHTNQPNKSNTEEFIKKSNIVHNNRYIYDKTNYITAIKKVTITCDVHGEFEMTPNSHLAGKGCRKCNTSKGENIVKSILVDNNIRHTEQYSNEGCQYKMVLRFDFAIFKDDKIRGIIEFQGAQHYKPVVFGSMSKDDAVKQFQDNQIRDSIKRDFCKNNNIPLLEIKYTDIKKAEDLILNFWENINSVQN